MPQPEVITIAFFPSEPLALRDVDEDIPAGSRKRRFQYLTCTTIQRNSGRLTEASIPVLNLYYDSTKFRPAHGNVDSSTTFVLRFNAIPAGSRKRRFQYYTCTTFESNSGRLTETSIPALNLYYDLTKFRPAHGNVDSRISHPQ